MTYLEMIHMGIQEARAMHQGKCAYKIVLGMDTALKKEQYARQSQENTRASERLI